MSAPRRRIIRPAPAATSPDRLLRIEKLRTGLARERETLARWMARLLCGVLDYAEQVETRVVVSAIRPASSCAFPPLLIRII
jgi:hypothetical protein